MNSHRNKNAQTVLNEDLSQADGDVETGVGAELLGESGACKGSFHLGGEGQGIQQTLLGHRPKDRTAVIFAAPGA